MTEAGRTLTGTVDHKYKAEMRNTKNENKN